MLPIDFFNGGFNIIPLRQNEKKINKIVVSLSFPPQLKGFYKK